MSISDSQTEKILEYLISLVDYEEPNHEDMQVEESKQPDQSSTKASTKGETAKSSSVSRPAYMSKVKGVASKTETDSKKSLDPDAEWPVPEEDDNVSLAVPAILNFINGYFLSRVSQNIDLSEIRQRRIERRKRQQEKASLAKKHNYKDLIKDDLAKQSSSSLGIEGFKEASFVKKDTIKDEAGNDLLCTFSKTQRNYQQQHWYMCYTCGLNGQEGVCSTCAKTCHKGHEVVYCRISSFFCDCQFKFKCVCLPDEFKENPSVPKKDMLWSGFNYESSPFSSEMPWRKDSRGGDFRGNFRGNYSRGMMRGRGRPPGGRAEDHELFNVYRK